MKKSLSLFHFQSLSNQAQHMAFLWALGLEQKKPQTLFVTGSTNVYAPFVAAILKKTLFPQL